MKLYMVVTYDMWWGENEMAMNDYKVVSSYGVFSTLEKAKKRASQIADGIDEFLNTITENSFVVSRDKRKEVIEPVGEESAYATGIIELTLDEATNIEFEW